MRLQRYSGIDDWLCFDENDEQCDSALKSMNIGAGFKNYIRAKNKLL